MDNIKYKIPTAADLPAMAALLADCHLSTDGIERLTENCLVATVASKLVGTVSLESCGASALLRSLAVAPDFRGRSLGCNLVARIVSHARLLGVERLYLLTTDAEQYFAGLGFKRIDRSEAPAPIQATAQFRSLCPKSAICLARDISTEAILRTSTLSFGIGALLGSLACW